MRVVGRRGLGRRRSPRSCLLRRLLAAHRDNRYQKGEDGY
jgi:hypothetical protein